jgi:hypothetical protein
MHIKTAYIASIQRHMPRFRSNQAVTVLPQRMIDSKHAQKESSRTLFFIAQHKYKYTGASLQTLPFNLPSFTVNQIK